MAILPRPPVKHSGKDSKLVHVYPQQEEIALWSGVKGNDSIHDEDGLIGHGLTMDTAKGLSIRERPIMLVLPTLTKKASEQEDEGKSLLINRCL